MRIDEERKKKLLFNSSMSLINQIVTVLCGVILPPIWLKYYGSEVYGLTTSIIQFLSFISFLDLGVGAVVQSSLYKPLAEKNDEEISGIVVSAERFFRKIAYILLGYIVLLIIFYPNLFASTEKFGYIYTASMILILAVGSFTQYYFGITYQLLISADQKAYIQLIIQCTTLIINTIFCIFFASRGMSIHGVKLVTTFIFLCRPILLNLYVKKYYNINKKVKLVKEPIKQKWNGVAQHLAYTVLNNTDVVVLTIFSTLKAVSIYSVYFNIVSGVKQVIYSVSIGMQALLGNMLAKDENGLLEETFEKYEWLMHTCVVLLFSCTNILLIPFIRVYMRKIIDANYIIPAFAFFISMSQAAYCIRLPYNTLVLAAGHYRETQTSAIIEMLLNILISIIGVIKYGLVGVAVGTFVAMLYRSVYLAWYLSKNIIYRKFIIFVRYIITDTTVLILCRLFTRPYQLMEITYFAWIILAVKVFATCAAVCFIINMCFYRKQLLLFVKKILKK